MTPTARRALPDVLPVGIMLLDPTGKILQANARAQRATGAGSSELVDDDFFERWGAVPGLERCENRFRAGSPFEATGLFPSTDAPTEVRMRYEPLDDDGRGLGLVTLEPDGGGALSLEALSAVRHDINNLLMGLMGHVEILGDYPELSDRARAKVRSIAEQVDRIKDRLAAFASATRR